MNLFADATNGTSPWMNPANWADFIKAVGVPTFIALLFVAYLIWDKVKNPSNAYQVRILRLLYADAQARNSRLRQLCRIQTDIGVDIATKLGLDEHDKRERIQQILDDGHTDIPPELALEDQPMKGQP